MPDLTIEDYRPDLFSWLLTLNQANLPEVGPLDSPTLDALIAMQHALRIAHVDQQPAGAIMLMLPGQDYASANYRWFCDRPGSFLYIDRVMVDAAYRGVGVGRALYEDAVDIAVACKAPSITCEINTQPPNPGSFAFHEKLGYRGILERDSDGGKRVMMMEKRL